MQKDNDFKKKLRETFRLEAEEHIRNLASGLINLEKEPDAQKKAAYAEDIFRESHSLKGSARVVGLTEIESVCQSLENVLSALRKNELSLSSAVFDQLHRVVDSLSGLLSSTDREKTPEDKLLVSKLVQILEDLAKGTPPLPLPAKAEPVKKENTPSQFQLPSTNPETVRVAAARLEDLLLQTQELLSIKQAANRLNQELEELDLSLLEWQREWQKSSLYISRLRTLPPPSSLTEGEKSESQLKRLLEFLDWNHNYFKSLESRIANLAQISKRDENTLDNLVNNLTQDMKKVLISPFSSLVEVFPKFVRDLAREQDKEIELVIRGQEIEIDRRILEAMKDPLTHLIRNAIDYGIEKKTIRRLKGKPDQGIITIEIQKKGGNNIELSVSDNGGGIDIPAIRQAAVKNGLIKVEQADKLSNNEVLSFIYRSGISTSSSVTAISGRGLGLAIVREKVEKLRGVISVQTQPDKGTIFRIMLPAVLTEFRGLVIRAAGQLLVIPTINVERAIRVSETDIRTVENRKTIEIEGQVIPLVRLSAVLEISTSEKNDKKQLLPVLLLSAAGIRLAFLVDEIIEEQEVLVKSLGKQLSNVRNVTGACILATGKVAPVLNVSDLMKSAFTTGVEPVNIQEHQEEAVPVMILVAEDSITSRTLLKNILETVGYRVRTAVDGVDALTQLQTEKFDLVVSDVDMPRMNGFDLTAKIRADRRLASLPVILVTALESREHREKGIDVGANAYIIKSSFDQSNLLETIRKLI